MNPWDQRQLTPNFQTAHNMTNMPPNSKPPVANGFINLFKPAGITSMDALRQIKRITGQRQKVGHGGTIDPVSYTHLTLPTICSV